MSKIKNGGLDQYGKCKTLKELAVKGLNVTLIGIANTCLAYNDMLCERHTKCKMLVHTSITVTAANDLGNSEARTT